MDSWSLDPGTVAPHRSFSRELGLAELGFYWDSAFNRTADTIQHIQVRPSSTAIYHNIFSPDRVRRAWTALKRRFPLLAARFDDLDVEVDGRVRFVVEERRLHELVADELTFKRAHADIDCAVMIDTMLNGDCPSLSNDLLARLIIMQSVEGERLIHVVFNVAHAITDGMANASICRSFFELLCSSEHVLSETHDLQSRLSMAVSSESLDPGLSISKPRRRWRLAIAHVIWNLRQEKMKVSSYKENTLVVG
jgi:hypothetical protein